ncbi:sensor domain-containing diguanylate cyclase [Rheinheimera sp. 4Y26]|uniref:sensor domain-containing diguanylate cyclase n=1 Tax=Rheinheimera sp. 4Y26 TaxID=2977811 RepID=UPI0021B139B5|nr:sensor domain-containing diguanylate cyclase [Rheinheimera sp. 4Y26]MCT6698948.1 diguanylate cyclase [Rheinheimera sp. 4Y26]
MQRTDWIEVAGTDRKRKKHHLLFLTFCLMVLISAVGLAYRFSLVEQQILDDIEHHASKMANTLNESLTETSLSLAMLATQFQLTVHSQAEFAAPLTFRSAQQGQKYQLTGPRQLQGQTLGDLTGEGELPAEGSVQWREMEAALVLTPLFEQIKQHDMQNTWLYYTSDSGFMYAYPYSQLDIDHPVTDKGVLFYQAILKDPFFTLATPAHNPERKLIWTPVYQDLAGQGDMITASQPVFFQQQFIGVLSIDISLSQLLTKLQFHELNATEMLMLTPEGTDVFQRQQVTFSQDPRLNKTDSFVHDGFLYQPLLQLNNGWRVLLKTDRHQIHLQTLQRMAFSMIALLLLICSVVLLWKLLASLHKIKKMSVTDGLTQLYNRRHFSFVFGRELKLQSRTGVHFGLIMLDIDFFKKYNDHYGHQAGDQVLIKVADCLRHTFRRQSDAVFRVGGEEFCLLLLAKSPEQLCSAMEMLCQAIRALQLPHVASLKGSLSVSVGGVWLDAAQQWDTEQAYKCADDALYQAKQQGRDGWVLYSAPEKTNVA